MEEVDQKPSLVLLQFLLLALYLILLSVLYLIQFGIGLFCFIFLASLIFFLYVFMEPYTHITCNTMLTISLFNFVINK